MKPSQSFFIVSMVAALISSALQCQPNSKIPDLTTDLISFQMTTNSECTQAYTFQTFNLSTPRKSDRNSQISYSFAIKDALTLTSNVMYFDLLVLQTYEARLIINFIYQPNKWSKISYNYLLSYRSDLYTGIQTYLENQFTKSNQSYVLQTGISIRQDSKESDYVVMAFINGLRYKPQENSSASHLHFAFTEQYVANYTLVLAFCVHAQAEVLSVTFSYLIYAPALVNFGSYGGTISQEQFKGKANKNLHYLFPSYHFQAIYGLSALETGGGNSSSFSFESQLRQNYSFYYHIKEWQTLKSLQISYIIFGVMPSKTCQKVAQCQTEGNVFIYQAQCVSSCPRQSKPVTYFDGAIQCQQCPPNKSYSNLTMKCECDQGYTLDSSSRCISNQPAQAKVGVTNSQQARGDSLDSSAKGESLESSAKGASLESSAKGESSESSQAFLQNCLSLKEIQQSNKNVFVKLKASELVYQDINSNDRNFVKLDFPDQTKAASSYFCSKCPSESDSYECLLLFARGVPVSLFTMHFTSSLTVKGQAKSCRLQVPYKSIKAQ